jgi:chemotaxis protein histidine kinase CheA
MPDEECMHFPGIAYDGQIAWALMKHNNLVETSLVYKNASPSSMLLRKAETLAQHGSLNERQIEQLEGRFQVRLPRFERRIFNGTPWTDTTTTNLSGSGTVTLVSSSADTANTTITGLGEESDMAGRRGAGTDATRELLRTALTTEPVPEDEDVEASTEAEAEGTTEATETAAEADETAEVTADETASADEPVEAHTEVAPEVEAAAEPDASTDVAVEEVVSEAPEVEAEAEVATEAETETAEAEAVSEAAVADVSESTSTEPETKEGDQPSSESTRAEDVISDFANAAEQLAAALARNPDAFDSGALAVAARAERSVDIALIDAGCDTTAGSHVSRTYETRSRHLREALGGDLTVEAIRSLVGRANLGDTLYEELVKDAVAARTGVQGEAFNAPKYRDILMVARDVGYVKDEIASWKDMKKDRFTAGRSVVPRQPVDIKSKADERKTLPEAPATLPANNGRGAPAMGSILEPRKK